MSVLHVSMQVNTPLGANTPWGGPTPMAMPMSLTAYSRNHSVSTGSACDLFLHLAMASPRLGLAPVDGVLRYVHWSTFCQRVLLACTNNLGWLFDDSMPSVGEVSATQ